jgi:hypothetical protein
MKSLVFLLLLALPIKAQLRIAAKGFKMAEADLRAIFTSTLKVFPRDPEKKDPPIYVTRHHNGPIVLFQRTPRGEVAMQLDTGDYYYSQIIYQFAHELAHIRADFQPIEHENKWLEETLCETASLFALRQLALRWEKEAPNNALKKYRRHLTPYAQRVIESREPLTPKTSPAFYQKHRETLRKSATERALNGAFANLILPLLEKEPVHWQTLTHFPRIKGATLTQHFQAWRKASPQKHHRFLTNLESLFLE